MGCFTKKQRIVSWFSCGAASAVATKLAIEENKKNDTLELVVGYCEVKEEHSDNKRFLSECQEWFGQEIVILGNDKHDRSIYKTFEDVKYLRNNHGAPCTRLLKKGVREAFQRLDDIHVFGYTLEEQKRVNDFIDANNDVELWSILGEKEITKQDCYAIVHAEGIELPEMYKLGYKKQ